MNRRDELQRLLEWAKRKRYTSLKNKYQNELNKIEKILARHAVRSRTAHKWAWRVFKFRKIAFGD